MVEYLIRVFRRVGFLHAAIAFEQRRAGSHVPRSVTLVLSEGALVIAPHEA